MVALAKNIEAFKSKPETPYGCGNYSYEVLCKRDPEGKLIMGPCESPIRIERKYAGNLCI